MKKRSQKTNNWKLLIPEKYSPEPYIIKTSPVVLGRSSQCDIMINDPSISESHIQFVLINNGRFLEIYDLAGKSSKNARTLFNGQSIDNIKIKAERDRSFAIKAGDVDIKLIYAPAGKKQPSKRRTVSTEREMLWYYFHEGEQHGPMKRASLLKAACEGLLLPMDDAWHSGLKYRIKAFEVPELFDPIFETGIGHNTGTDITGNSIPGSPVAHNASVLPDSHDKEGLLCPCCWHRYEVEDLLYISRHPDLTGDPVLGSEEQQRFLPREFKPVRRALDMRGEVCSEMACPRCHLRIPTPFLDTSPLFFSIIGSPGSGKSYYLASSTWMLRKVLPRYFGLNFEDIDNVTNQWLNEYEEELFFPVNDMDHNAIEKTQIEAPNLSKQVKINDITMSLPLPAIFTLLSKDRHDKMRTLAVYDNAGEHFQTGQDVIQKPGTLHMLQAHGFLFLFDPTADPRFNDLINEDVKGKVVQTVYQQQKILIETIDRLRKHSGLNVADRFEKPIVIGLSKADLLSDYFSLKGVQFKGTPLKWVKKGKSAGLDMGSVHFVSSIIRDLFYKLVPEYVNTIESFGKNIIYLPVSAIGHQPDQMGVNPRDIKPLWVEVPFLYILFRLGYIPAI